ncbi:META domain-containing protein [Rhodocyclaceae bacterium SMB388]
MTRYPNKPVLLSALLLGLSACATVAEPDRAGSASMAQTVYTALHFDCGDLSVLLTDVDSTPVLVAAGESIPMHQTRAASGVRYEATQDASTVLHMKGDAAWVDLRGRDRANCTLTTPPAQPFTAQGQEPPWRVQVMDDAVTLTTGYAGAARTLALSSIEQSGLTTRMQAADRAGVIALAIVGEVCRDSMSGMPHPYSVVLSGIDGAQPGCGGQPIDLLAGREWIIQSLDGVTPTDGSPVTLRFLKDTGRIAGTGSCNRYHAGYTLDGESLRFTHAATTMMACAPNLMDQEQRFHSILSGIDRFDFDLDGRLILGGANGQLVATASPLSD